MSVKEKRDQNYNEKKRVSYCWYKAVDSFTAPEALAEYACDPNPLIRRTVANNINTARETIIKLSGDQDKTVAEAASKHLDLMKKSLSPPTLEP